LHPISIYSQKNRLNYEKIFKKMSKNKTERFGLGFVISLKYGKMRAERGCCHEKL